MNRLSLCLATALACFFVLLGCSSKPGSSTPGAAGSAGAPGSAGSAGASTTDGGPSGDAGALGEAGASSADATLSALDPSAGAFITPFTPTKTSYTLRVPNGTKSVSLTPTSSDANAAITVAGRAVASGAASQLVTIPADPSSLDIAVVVTSADASTQKTYDIHLAVQAVTTGITIHSVGDSTMADYDATVDLNQRGWMQMFPEFVSSDVTVKNSGINGTSSKSYYLSGAWTTVKASLNVGDYVFIQFAHNDEKDGGIEGPGGIGTAAFGAYHDYLTKYVNETRALGAIPILFTPVVRLSWSGTSISPIGCHDLTGNGTAVGDANYPEAMRDVATTLKVPLVDLTVATKALAEEYGPTDAKAMLYIAADDTHLQVMGATVYAGLAVQGLIDGKLLAAVLNPVLGLRLSDSKLDFGSRYLGSTLDDSFSLLGLSLTPDAGNVTVTAPTGFLVGTDPSALGPTLDLPYTRGALPPTVVYVRFQALLAQPYSASLDFATDTPALASLALTATGVALPAGGTPVEARYALDSDAAGVSCTVSGGVTCGDETFTGLYVKDYQALTTLSPVPTSLMTQALSILSTPTADSWPLETAPSADRYVEFSIAPPAGKSLSLDTVSLYAGGAGGPTLAFELQSSTQADFSSPSVLLDAPDNATNALTFHAVSPLTVVAAGDTFHLRLLPYSKALATKKYLGLQSVVLHGVVY